MGGCSNECDKEFGTKHPGKIIINKIENFNQVCKKCGDKTTFTQFKDHKCDDKPKEIEKEQEVQVQNPPNDLKMEET